MDVASISLTLLPSVPHDYDNTFLATLSAKSDEALHSVVESLFDSFPSDVRVVYGQAECSSSCVESVEDVLDLIDTVRSQHEHRGYGGCLGVLTLYADPLRGRNLTGYDHNLLTLLVRLWSLCKELERTSGWEWDVALMEAVPHGITLAEVLQNREQHVRRLVDQMVPAGYVTRERRSLVEAGLLMFALFETERAVQIFVDASRVQQARMVED
jgi:hypothetical protein